MFHNFDAQVFEPQNNYARSEARWYVSDEEYQEAVRRGMLLRSDIAARTVKALFRRLRGLI